MFSPRARYRFYGTPDNYFTALRLLKPGVAHKANHKANKHEASLERAVEKMIGVAHARCMPQARYGIYLALRALIEPGQKVILSPYTIYDVVNMVIAAGGRPVFADIQSETCNIDPAEVERLIDDETGAVMITHLHGLACDVGAIARVCRSHGVPLLEDAAQAFGAKVGDQMVGSFGDVSVFSFGRAKNINCFFGGMVVTQRDDVHEAICAALDPLPYEETGRLLKRILLCLVGDLMTLPFLFWLITFRIFRFGATRNVAAVNKIVQTEDNPVRREDVPESYHRRMTPTQAEIVERQLPQCEPNNRVRIRNAGLYFEGLKDLPGVKLPPWTEDGSHIYLQFPIQVSDRWNFVRFMMRHGRDVAIQHMQSAAELEIFSDCTRDCPAAKATAASVVLLPTYPGYGEHEVRETIRVVRDYFASSSKT